MYHRKRQNLLQLLWGGSAATWHSSIGCVAVSRKFAVIQSLGATVGVIVALAGNKYCGQAIDGTKYLLSNTGSACRTWTKITYSEHIDGLPTINFFHFVLI